MATKVTIEDVEGIAGTGPLTEGCFTNGCCEGRREPNPQGYLEDSIQRKLIEIDQLRLLRRSINWAMLSDGEAEKLEHLFVSSAL